MLMAEYSYETDIEVQREEAAEEAEERDLLEYVEKVSKNFHVTEEEACRNLGKSYEKYLEAKKKYSQTEAE